MMPGYRSTPHGQQLPFSLQSACPGRLTASTPRNRGVPRQAAASQPVSRRKSSAPLAEACQSSRWPAPPRRGTRGPRRRTRIPVDPAADQAKPRAGMVRRVVELWLDPRSTEGEWCALARAVVSGEEPLVPRAGLAVARNKPGIAGEFPQVAANDEDVTRHVHSLCKLEGVLLFRQFNTGIVWLRALARTHRHTRQERGQVLVGRNPQLPGSTFSAAFFSLPGANLPEGCGVPLVMDTNSSTPSSPASGHG